MKNIVRRQRFGPGVTFDSRRQFVVAASQFAVASLLTGGSLFRSAYGASGAFDYYIAPNGSDSNPGTIGAPWAITAINTKKSLYAGKRVGLLDGTYNVAAALGGYSSWSWSQAALDIAGGQSGSPTVVAAVNAGKAVLDAQATSSNNSDGAAVIGSNTSTGYVTIDGLEIKNCYYQAIRFSGDTSFTGTHVFGIVVKNCFIHNVTNTTKAEANPCAIQSNNLDGALFQNNRLQDLTSFDDRMSGYIFWSAHNTVVEYNSIINTTIGVHFKNQNNTNNIVRYSYIDMSGSSGQRTGIKLDSQASSGTEQIHNNVIVADSPLDTDMYPFYNDDAYFFNNTLVGVPGWATAGIKLYQGSGNSFVYNNIFSRGSVGYRGDASLTQGRIALCDYNCWPASPILSLYAPGSDSSVINTLNGLTLIKSTTSRDAHSIAVNQPGFVGVGAEAAFYRLSSGSPAANAGRIGGIAGGAATDMGAWGNGATKVGAGAAQAQPDAVHLSVS